MSFATPDLPSAVTGCVMMTAELGWAVVSAGFTITSLPAPYLPAPLEFHIPPPPDLVKPAPMGFVVQLFPQRLKSVLIGA